MGLFYSEETLYEIFIKNDYNVKIFNWNIKLKDDISRNL